MNPITQQGSLTGSVLAQLNANLQAAGIVTQGNIYWVRPRLGSDSYDGLSPATAFRSLPRALQACTANRNDVVLLCGEGNSANDTTARLAANLDWNKDLTHLVGINDGPQLGQRSRIAFVSTFDAAVPMMTVSANGCLFQNLGLFAGVAGTLPTGCLSVTGDRNNFVNCQISGMGNSANVVLGLPGVGSEIRTHSRRHLNALGLVIDAQNDRIIRHSGYDR